MTLTELRYIVAVAQDRHFGRASARCFITQPALSLAIQKLEDELGIAVFERRKNDVKPTLVGEKIVEQAQRVLEEADRIKQIAAQGKDQLVGPFRLGVIATHPLYEEVSKLVLPVAAYGQVGSPSIPGSWEVRK